MLCNYPFQIVSNGIELYIVLEDGLSFKIKKPILTQYSLFPNLPLEISSFSGYKEYLPQEGGDLDLSFQYENIKSIKSSDILLNFFQSASIRDLLIEINKKIEERK